MGQSRADNAVFLVGFFIHPSPDYFSSGGFIAFCHARWMVCSLIGKVPRPKALTSSEPLLSGRYGHREEGVLMKTVKIWTFWAPFCRGSIRFFPSSFF